MIGFASKGYSDYPNIIGFETACENPKKKKNVFEIEIDFEESEKDQILRVLRSTNKPTAAICTSMRVEKNNRLRTLGLRVLLLLPLLLLLLLLLLLFCCCC